MMYGQPGYNCEGVYCVHCTVSMWGWGCIVLHTWVGVAGIVCMRVHSVAHVGVCCVHVHAIL